MSANIMKSDDGFRKKVNSVAGTYVFIYENWTRIIYDTG